MENHNSTKYHQIPPGFTAFQDGFVTRKLPCRILVSRLRNFLDKVTDPTYQQEHPFAWAKDYGALLNLLLTQDINQKHVRHNLGKKRRELIHKILLNIKEQIEEKEMMANNRS